jgi:hypothetical protein
MNTTQLIYSIIDKQLERAKSIPHRNTIAPIIFISYFINEIYIITGLPLEDIITTVPHYFNNLYPNYKIDTNQYINTYHNLEKIINPTNLIQQKEYLSNEYESSIYHTKKGLVIFKDKYKLLNDLDNSKIFQTLTINTNIRLLAENIFTGELIFLILKTILNKNKFNIDFNSNSIYLGSSPDIGNRYPYLRDNIINKDYLD